VVFQDLLRFDNDLGEISQHDCVSAFFRSVLPEFLRDIPIEFVRAACSTSESVQSFVHFVFLEEGSLRVAERLKGFDNSAEFRRHFLGGYSKRNG
jgi:hypothetical protein